MTILSIPIKEVEYRIIFSNINKPIIGQTDTKKMDTCISIEIAWLMIYKSSIKFNTFDEYKRSEDPNIMVDVIVTINNRRKIYTINENLLMYIYNYKFDEYYVESEYIESEYEISDWAISSPSSSSSTISTNSISSLEYDF